jgi:hypothetical protein
VTVSLVFSGPPVGPVPEEQPPLEPLDFTALDTYVEKFRKGSPNIARAFDEVKVLLIQIREEK